MNDAWTERLKVVKEIVLILVPLITALLAGWNVKQINEVQAHQQVNAAKIDEAKATAEDTKKTLDTVVRMGMK